MRRPAALACALALTLAASAPLAQQLDRTKPPTPGPVPELQVPSWTTGKLSNGAQLIVAERRDLPLVYFSVTFEGGANQLEKADKLGVAAFTSAMMREGTKTRSAEQLALDLQLLGTNVGIGIGDESGSMSFLSTTEKFEPTLEILADMLMNPTFPEPALDRLRQQRLIALKNQNAQPGFIANRVFARVLYGADHPFGQTADADTLQGVTRDDIVALHKEYFRPGRAIVTVAGDIDAASAKAAAEKALEGWAGGAKPAFAYPKLPEPRKTTIYAVDRPGSKQSVISIGLPGPPRSTPDYMALQVMNFILGGHFQSRLNANIREEKGYSYGVGSGFSYGKGPGPFRASGDVVSDKTDAALVEFMKELRGIQGGRPITDEEMQMAKDTLIQRLPGQFASVQAVAGAITGIYLQGLPEDYYQNYAKNVRAVTREDVLRVAKQYIALDRLNIVVVGDLKTIQKPLEATGLAPIVVVDQYGK